MHEFYPTLLSPIQIGGRVLKNHMICPPSAPGTIQEPRSNPPGRVSSGGIAAYSLDRYASSAS